MVNDETVDSQGVEDVDLGLAKTSFHVENDSKALMIEDLHSYSGKKSLNCKKFKVSADFRDYTYALKI